MTDRILQLCKGQLRSKDKSRDAAGYLASKFLTRPDTRDSVLPEFLDWALLTLIAAEAPESDISGGLAALAAVVKHSKREDLLKFAPNILGRLIKSSLRDHCNTFIRKLYLKLVQRLGLIFLKSKVAAWRYKRGSRSLTINLNAEKAVEVEEKGDGLVEEMDDEYDVPEEVEDVIEELLAGLRDRETVVRWTAAKGIGRVTGRLPRDLADEVVGSLLELFSDRETDSAWHGSCLAIAELGRRGLLLPNRLEKVVDFITKALVYDEKRGSFSVGSHIRDAACYVCWSFARAYDPEVTRPFVHKIASSLLIVTVFDREVNCRRAASAAFQENVGRQGTFPHGIDILTTADYFSVGQRSNAYLNISEYVAGFGEYSQPLISHLLHRKVGHWDPAVRELSAKALNRLCGCNLEYVLNEVLGKLLDMSVSSDIFSSHGATLAVGQIVLAISDIARKAGTGLREKLGTLLAPRIENLVDRLVQGNKLRGLGGELMRQATAQFIANCSQAKLDVSQAIVKTWKTVLDENLSDMDSRVQSASVAAIPALTSQYYCSPVTGEVDSVARDSFVHQYLNMLKGNEQHRKGFSLALGSLEPKLLIGVEEEIIHCLIICSRVSEGTEKWAEGRRDALKALTSVCTKLAARLTNEQIHFVYDSFMIALDDYTLDRRGDVGAWVREAALTGIELFTLKLLEAEECRIPASIVGQFMPLLVQQAVEKIDRTRGHAGRIFHTLLHAEHEGRAVPGIRDRERLHVIFPKDCDLKWAVESETFPLFVKLLHLVAYGERLLVGLIVSVGGLTERLVKNSSQSLFHELDGMGPAEIKLFCDHILKIFRMYEKNDRVTIPFLKFLDQVLTTSCLSLLMESSDSEFPLALFSLCKSEITKCGEPNKLMASSEVFCQLLQAANPECIRRSLVQIAIFLCHRFPRVRKYTADKFYEALLTFSDREIVPEENLDAVMTLLSETNWIEMKVEELRATRNQICQLAGVQPPTVVSKQS